VFDNLCFERKRKREMNITNKVDSRQVSDRVVDFYIKRAFDYSFAGIFLILCMPLFVILSLSVSIDSPGPIFYKQQRVGLKKDRFYMWKFRTMVMNADQIQSQLELNNDISEGILFKLKQDPRVTTVGKFLRRSSLDEIPQLINVLMGDMSIIGPRPLSIRDAEKLPDRIDSRYDVLPGITGLWQVKGRSSLDSQELFFWDDIYINQWCLVLDLKIMLRTILVVIKGEGSY
jgi:lipopolysaccharide/colanic/teichoic acid biosynthesis glycosyltransferase